MVVRRSRDIAEAYSEFARAVITMQIYHAGQPRLGYLTLRPVSDYTRQSPAPSRAESRLPGRSGS